MQGGGGGGGVVMGFCWRIDRAQEARHREQMVGMGVSDAEWALCKVLMESDVQKGQNRLLLSKDMVRGGPIPRLFPELEELDGSGRNAEHTVSVTLLDAEGREKVLSLRYLNSNKAYRVFGPGWKRFVQASGMCTGDCLVLYACRRRDGERCLFSFTSKGGGGASSWCTNNRRKRARQPATAAGVQDHKRRLAKSGRAGIADHTRPVMNDAGTGGLQGDYGRCKAAEGTREVKAPPRSWKDYATIKKENEAARGLLMLKYAILAAYYY